MTLLTRRTLSLGSEFAKFMLASAIFKRFGFSLGTKVSPQKYLNREKNQLEKPHSTKIQNPARWFNPNCDSGRGLEFRGEARVRGGSLIIRCPVSEGAEKELNCIREIAIWGNGIPFREEGKKPHTIAPQTREIRQDTCRKSGK